MLDLLTSYALLMKCLTLGNIILDPGSHSSEGGHHMMAPMMSLMGHFNPYSFYPMQQQHQPPPMMVHPIYIEDHSALHQHQPVEQQHHEEPAHQYQQHYESEHQQSEMHHEEQHPMEGHYGEQEGHHGEEEEGGEHQMGYEQQQHPLMTMMMHGSGLQPAYQQMIPMQALQQPAVYAQIPSQGSSPEQQVAQMAAQLEAVNAAAASAASGQQGPQGDQEVTQTASSNTGNQLATGAGLIGGKKTLSLIEKSANNPLVQIIKPLFKRNKESKKEQKDSSEEKSRKTRTLHLRSLGPTRNINNNNNNNDDRNNNC